MVRYNRGTSSQSAFFGEACTNNKIDVVGAAYSSIQSGQIDVYGKPLAATEDHRLPRTLIRAGWNFLTKTGLTPL
jgi:hypothetical protein